MKVLITGGAGYIGTELVFRLAANPEIESIIVYDNLDRGNYNLFLGDRVANPKVRFVNGDLLDSRKIRKTLEGMDKVIHLAAKVTTPFANIDSHSFEQINHWGTAELIYAVEESDVKQFIFMSSSSVYGSSKEEATENTPPSPDSFYAISKWRGEGHVQRLFEKLNTQILRCGNVYGYSKSMRFDAVINRFMFDANYSNRITIQGNGKQFRSFIHVEKVTHILEQLLLQQVPSGVYNLSDKNMQIMELVNVIKQLYPDLEFLFINQHLEMQQMKVKHESNLYKLIPLPSSEISDELKRFKENFSFHPVLNLK